MLYKAVLVSVVQCKSALSMGMYASPPSQTSLRPPAPLGCLLCAILVPSSAKSFEPFSSHCPLSLLFPHLPVQQLSSSLRMTCMPDAGFICLVSLSPAFDPGSTPSLLKFLVHVMCLPWVTLPHTLPHTLASVASPDIPKCPTCVWPSPLFSQVPYP